MIRIETTFKDAGKFKNLIRYIENNLIYAEAQEKIIALGNYTVADMRNTIRTSKKRPGDGQNKLENTIDSEIISTTAGVEVGIGNINKLKTEAPYFEVIDAGGYVPPTNIGFFGAGQSPTKGGFGQKWTHTGSKAGFLLKPKKAIEGIHYVSKAIGFINKELKIMVIKLGGKFIKNLDKASK